MDVPNAWHATSCCVSIPSERRQRNTTASPSDVHLWWHHARDPHRAEMRNLSSHFTLQMTSVRHAQPSVSSTLGSSHTAFAAVLGPPPTHIFVLREEVEAVPSLKTPVSSHEPEVPMRRQPRTRLHLYENSCKWEQNSVSGPQH